MLGVLENKMAKATTDDFLTLEAHAPYAEAAKRLEAFREQLATARSKLGALEGRALALETGLAAEEADLTASGLGAKAVDDRLASTRKTLERTQGELGLARGEVRRLELVVGACEKKTEAERQAAVRALGDRLRERLKCIQRDGVMALSQALANAKSECDLVDAALLECGLAGGAGRTFPPSLGSLRRVFGPADCERIESCLARVAGQLREGK